MKKQEDTTSCDHIDQQHKHLHPHTKKLRGKKLLWVTLLNFSISFVQVAGGIISNSLSLISDAIHNLGDTSAIFIAFLAGKHANKNLMPAKLLDTSVPKFWRLSSMRWCL